MNMMITYDSELVSLSCGGDMHFIECNLVGFKILSCVFVSHFVAVTSHIVVVCKSPTAHCFNSRLRSCFTESNSHCISVLVAVCCFLINDMHGF